MVFYRRRFRRYFRRSYNILRRSSLRSLPGLFRCSYIIKVKLKGAVGYTFTTSDELVPDQRATLLPMAYILASCPAYQSLRQVFNAYSVKSVAFDIIPEPSNRANYGITIGDNISPVTCWTGTVAIGITNRREPGPIGGNSLTTMTYDQIVELDQGWVLDPGNPQRKYFRTYSQYLLFPGYQFRDNDETSWAYGAINYLVLRGSAADNTYVAVDNLIYPEWKIKVTFYIMCKSHNF